MQEYSLEKFEQGLKELDIHLSDRQKEQFIQYYEILVEWNKVMNLTGITEYEEVIEKHFLDSLSIVKACKIEEKERIIDIGTGAGFPGIPLKIVFPEVEIVLLDSLKKRIGFLDEVIKQLQLEKIETIHGRAEDFARKEGYREAFDLAVSRAVANLSSLSEYCLPYVQVMGDFISYKSGKVSEEIEAAKKAISILGGKVEKKEEFSLGDASRSLIVIKKIKNTSKKYPRKSGLPTKEPLA